MDEIHSFVAKKQRHLTDDDPADMGDTWTFVGLDAIRKTIVGYRVGKRTGATADVFALDLRQRIVNQPQISSDGYAPYCEAIALSFGREVDYGQVVKQYGGNPSRYRGSIKTPIFGNPAPETMGTSHIERENLTTRMNIRRFARRTNGFSKRLRHHTAAFALYAAHYNFNASSGAGGATNTIGMEGWGFSVAYGGAPLYIGLASLPNPGSYTEATPSARRNPSARTVTRITADVTPAPSGQTVNFKLRDRLSGTTYPGITCTVADGTSHATATGTISLSGGEDLIFVSEVSAATWSGTAFIAIEATLP